MFVLQGAKSLFTFKRFSNISLSSNIYFGRYSVIAFNGCRGISSQVATIEERMDAINEFNSIKINEKLKKAIIQDFGFRIMSPVQKSILTVLDWQRDEEKIKTQNGDLLVRAKTGTGKTMAFLIYAIEKALASNSAAFSNRKIPIFVLSPTRELALQIAAEAKRLTKHMGLSIRVAVGGTSRSDSISDIRKGCDIIVATPGRIDDLIQNESFIRDKFDGLQVLVFDEADVLLEMGFATQIKSILSRVPGKEQRTTIMFSATVSKKIQEIASLTLQDGYQHIDCIPSNELDTHMKIKQSYAVVPAKEHLYLLQDIILRHKNENSLAKIMLFLPATSQVVYVAELLNKLNLPGLSTMMIHSKMTQPARARVSQQFRSSRSSILVTTDVSARGVDYPNVTQVLQVGMPSSREQYVHKIGRTGRAGKEGEAILILSPCEKAYLNHLSKVPIQQELGYKPSVSAQDASRIKTMTAAAYSIDESVRKDAALSFIQFHLNHLSLSGMRKDTCIKGGKDFATGFTLLEKFPVISNSFAQRLGIAGLGLEGSFDRPLPFVSHGNRSSGSSREGRSTRAPRGRGSELESTRSRGSMSSSPKKFSNSKN